MAELITEVLVTIIAFILFGSKVRIVWNQETRSRSTVGFTVFFGLLGLCFLLQIDAVYIAFGEYTVANLGWYISYLAMTIGLFFLVEWRNGIEERPKQHAHLFLVGCIGTIALFSLIYWLFLQYTPESLNHNIPRSLPELIYILAFHLYALVMLLSPLAMVKRMWKKELLLAGRFRLGVFLVLFTTTWLWLLLKTIQILTRYFTPQSVVTATVILFPVFVGIVGVMIVVSLLPNSMYVKTARLVDRLRDTYALISLAPLTLTLEKLCKPTFYYRVPLKVQIKRPTLYLRQQIIFVLDSRKILSAYDTTDTPIGKALDQIRLSGDYCETVSDCCHASRKYAEAIVISYVKGKINAIFKFKLANS